MVVRGGGLPLLVRLLASNNVKCQGPAAAALWQLCGDRGIREEIGMTDAPKAAVHALQAQSTTVQENAAGLVASLAQNRMVAVRPASPGFKGAHGIAQSGGHSHRLLNELLPL